MMKKIFLTFLLMFSLAASAVSEPMPLVLQAEGTGEACLKEQKTKSATERVALILARRAAAENAATLLSSYTEIQDGQLLKDVVIARVNEYLRTIDVPEKVWFEQPGFGMCFRTTVRIEILPKQILGKE